MVTPGHSAVQAINAVLDRIRTRFHNPATFISLSHGEQLVYELGFTMDAEVQNGGWHQYLGNSSGNHAELHKQYLREVGANDVLALLEQVSSVFPNGVVPSDWNVRNRRLRAAVDQDPRGINLFDDGDRAYYRIREEFHRRLIDYAHAHRKDLEQP